MPRARTKVAAAHTASSLVSGPYREAAGVKVTDVAGQTTFIPVFSAGVKVLRTEAEEKAAFKAGLSGVYVKLMPTIRASQRQSVDTKAIRDKYTQAGAIAVVIAPVVVPDGVQDNEPEKLKHVSTPEMYLRAWFAGVKAPKGTIEEAIQEAMKTIDEAGL